MKKIRQSSADDAISDSDTLPEDSDTLSEDSHTLSAYSLSSRSLTPVAPATPATSTPPVTAMPHEKAAGEDHRALTELFNTVDEPQADHSVSVQRLSAHRLARLRTAQNSAARPSTARRTSPAHPNPNPAAQRKALRKLKLKNPRLTLAPAEGSNSSANTNASPTQNDKKRFPILILKNTKAVPTASTATTAGAIASTDTFDFTESINRTAEDITLMHVTNENTSSISGMGQREHGHVAPTTNRPWGRKGKAPVYSQGEARDAMEAKNEDHEMVDAASEEDEVDEGIFEDDAFEDEELEDEIASVISLSSGDDDVQDTPSDPDMNDRPWRHDEWSHAVREQWELMFCQICQIPIHGSWELTEEYQENKDGQMLLYMEDYPLSRWVIPQEEAQNAYQRLLERGRWRKLGIRTYGRDPMPTAALGMSQHMMQNQVLVGSQQYHRPQTLSHNAPGAQQTSTGQRTPPSQHQTSHNGPPQLAIPPHQAHMAHVQQMQAPHQQYATSFNHSYPGPLTGSSSRMTGPDTNINRKRRPAEGKEKDPGHPILPPYPERKKPAAFNLEPNKRRTIKAVVFPWNRNIDFMKAKQNASWDESKYDRDIMNKMTSIRERNWAIIGPQDQEMQAKLKGVKKARKQGTTAGTPDENVMPAPKATKTPKKGETGGDPNRRGNFSFITEADQTKFKAELGHNTPEEIIEAAQAGQIDWEYTKNIMICWNSVKPGVTEELEQVVFRLYDSLITREQLDRTLVLTDRAAECIIDFCPDLLWNDILLRIFSETKYSNTSIRDRIATNGCYVDKATMTKRKTSALGSKQVQTKPRKTEDLSSSPGGNKNSNRWGEGEEEWFVANKQDQLNYKAFFQAEQSKVIIRTPVPIPRPVMGSNSRGPETEASSSRQRSATTDQTDDGNATSKPNHNDQDDVSLQDSEMLDSDDPLAP